MAAGSSVISLSERSISWRRKCCRFSGKTVILLFFDALDEELESKDNDSNELDIMVFGL